MILIDDRDGSRPLADLPPLDGACALARLDFDIDGKMVPCGDVMLTGHGPNSSTLKVGVEAKSVHDLLSSISTGRLGGTQIQRMIRVFDVIYILTYGEYRVGPNNFLQVLKWKKGKKTWQQFRLGKRSVPWSYLEGFILTAQLQATIGGRPLFHKHVHDINEAACWLRTLDHWLEKPWDKHRALSVFDRSHDISAPPNADPVEVQIAKTAASLPAIDWVRGWRAAKHFSSVEEMMDASINGWTAVPGIGPVIARSAFTAIRRRKDGSTLISKRPAVRKPR